jgi:hypothetical protein
MRCVILQPSYIPWRGYFDLIHRADVFVFYDDVQYDARGWRNRNRIKTPNGTRWLTIPVRKHGSQTAHIPINAIEIADDAWAQSHLDALRAAYRRAPHFKELEEWLVHMYAAPPRNLAEFTIAATVDIARRLGIESTRFMRSSELAVEGRRTDRLIAVLQAVGADHYLSGPSARDYIEPAKFDAAGIALEWMTYDYPQYSQPHPPFDPRVSIIDLLVSVGREAPRYIWGD